MQQFLVTGQALYALAVICGLGVFCKWMTRILYKRMIKEAGNLAMTKNKNLKILRQKVESTYRMNSGVGNIETYLEHQMYDFKFMGVTLNGWGNFSNQMTFLCLLAGGAAAFLSYWYRCDSYYIVLYGSMGILGGLFALMIDSGANLNEKREQLLIALEDYMDNSLFFRPGRGKMGAVEEEGETTEQENITTARTAAARRSSKRRERENTARGAGENGKRSVREKIEEKCSQNGKASVKELTSDSSIEELDELEPGTAVSFTQNQRTDYLKHSLEQIAASRERRKDEPSKENWLKDLNPQEMKILGDIIKEYLA